MLFSYSCSCSEQKVFLLVVFDPTEMPYICQRKGDPTGTKQELYQHDVTLPPTPLSLSLSLAVTFSTTPLPLSQSLRSFSFSSLLFVLISFMCGCHAFALGTITACSESSSATSAGFESFPVLQYKSTGINVLFCGSVNFNFMQPMSHLYQ